MANADGHGQPQALTSFPEGQVGRRVLEPDSQTVYFPHDGDLWQVATGGARPSRYGRPRRTKRTSSLPLTAHVWLLSRRMPEVADGAVHKSELMVRWLADGSESTIAHNNVSITRPIWSPDGASLAYTPAQKSSITMKLPPIPDEKIIYRIWEYVPGQIYAVKLAGGEACRRRRSPASTAAWHG